MYEISFIELPLQHGKRVLVQVASIVSVQETHSVRGTVLTTTSGQHELGCTYDEAMAALGLAGDEQ